MMKTICVILGTRPEAIKLAPVILALKKNKNFNVLVCNTEQQKELSNQTLSFFDIKADFRLDVMRPNQTLSGLQACILEKLYDVYDNNQIDATIVQGDTMTVFSGALNSFYHKVPVFHVEAGLRSNDLFEPFPEEAMRQMTSRIANLHFAPTNLAYKALLKEGVKSENIVLTGNTVVDALSCLSKQVLISAEKSLQNKGVAFSDKLVLVTVHRRENHGDRLVHILSAIKKLAKQFNDHQFVLPVHPNPNVHDKVYEVLEKVKNIVLTTPLDYPELVALMKNTKLILTDSGGIQEEAPTFGNPVLVMRYETERMEGIEAGFSKLVGADEKKIIFQAGLILSQRKEDVRFDGRQNPYGDGMAAQKIVEAIETYFKRSKEQ